MDRNNYIFERALKKLNRIIEREGTAGGERLTVEYFEQLISEARREAFFEKMTFGGAHD